MLCNIFRVNLLTTWQKFHGKKCLYVISNIINGRTLSSITTPDGIEIRKLQKDDVPQLVKNLLPPERWNLNENDFYFALEIDPDGSIIAINEKGVIIGCSVAFKIDEKSTLGLLYWVMEKYQSRGIGSVLYKYNCDYVNKRNFFITAAPAMKDKYEERSGMYRGYILHRYVGKPEILPIPNVNDIQIKNFSSDSLDKIMDYHSYLSLERSHHLLEKYIHQKDTMALLAFRNSKLCGYGIIRDNSVAPRIVPLFADNNIIAKLLFVSLYQRFPQAQEKGIWIEIPMQTEEMIQYLKDSKLHLARTHPFMFLGENLLLYNPKIFARHLWNIVNKS